ncbi:WD repeat-containing protein 3 [Senna tora]|uniref:WD repeat-containing protein 3 n=1 Tax=Senna tora TaxID=362788 RepID=A0A834WCU1_9FABA|nr:WD repeat-containing protein 3 [Senna tora]
MAAPLARARTDYDCLIKLLLIGVGKRDICYHIFNSQRGAMGILLHASDNHAAALDFSQVVIGLLSTKKKCGISLLHVFSTTYFTILINEAIQAIILSATDCPKLLVSISSHQLVRASLNNTLRCLGLVINEHQQIFSERNDPPLPYLVVGCTEVQSNVYRIKLMSIFLCSQSHYTVLLLFNHRVDQLIERIIYVRIYKAQHLLASALENVTDHCMQIHDSVDGHDKARIELQLRKAKRRLHHNLLTAGEPNETINPTVTIPDVFKLLHTLRASKKICSISFCPVTPKNSLATLALSLNNNLLEFYSIENAASTKTLAIELQGHRSDVRSVTLSSDNTLLMSTSHNAVKIWNPSTGSCLRTIDSGYGLCGFILPHSKYGLVGTKSGSIEIIDIGSGTCLEVVEAHGGSVRSIAALPDENGFVTGSADHDVKFWEYEIKQKSGQVNKQLTVSNVRTMKMNDDVLVVAVSPDAKYIAVALLDCTVKIHFVDTFKFFLSLYGHKLPVLCMDISSDGELIVTGSADKNLKIWGLDFGDCHKSIFAHADSVMAVQFVPKTHYVFSVGKDRLVKYWDADKFELLLTLEGHHADIWCLAISSRGDFVVTGSHDRSIRRWDRTEDQFFIEEEKEKRLEEMFEADIDNAFENKYASKEEIPEEGAVAVAGKKTQETLTATDLIIERLDIAEAEKKRITEHREEKNSSEVAVFQPNPLMNGQSPSDYVLSAFSDVHSSDLEQTLLALPFSDALNLLSYLKDWISYSDKVELVCRVSTLLLQTHHNQLVTTPAARHVLTVLSDFLYKKVKGCKDTFGFNLAAMDHIQQMMASRSDAIFRDAKSKLQGIRAQQSKRLEERSDTGEVKRKKKRKTKAKFTGVGVPRVKK